LARGDPYEQAAQALVRAERLGARIVTPQDDEYPAQLEDLVYLSQDVADPILRNTYPPHCLWVRGSWRLAEACERSVAVVGARACTAYGDSVAVELGYGLAERGWTVVSGGAFGIDHAAHRGALAGGGVTVAVLAGGMDRPYPRSHIPLFERVAATGLLMTEWPPGSDPLRHRFLIRNRVIAAITRGTVMVEAHARSGARNTLNRARELNRMELAVPGPVTSAASVGCHEAIRAGATLVASVAQVLDAVGRLGAEAAPPERGASDPRDDLTPIQAQVLDGVRPRKILTAEEIAVTVGVGERDARRALPALIVAGFITETADGYRLARPADTDPTRRRRKRLAR
jgi:DNA processing protein